MANKFRQLAQQLKERVNSMPQLLQGKDKVDQLLFKYKASTGTKVSELAEKFKHDSLGKKVKELVSKYEKFTGVEEIMAIQNTVIDAQEHFIAAQERRRDLGRQLATIEARLKELHAEMQNTMKGDEKYLQLCTEEHKLIVQERALRTVFAEAEREERELFASMSAAVKLGHERERAHAERNKYWYIVASIFGTVLGIAGSTINNRLKMAEFRDMMEQQMAKSASVMYTIAGGRAAPPTDITAAMRTEFAYQEQLAQNLRVMQENINHLVNKQSTLVEHLNHQEHNLDKHMRDLKRIIVAASQNSAKSDAALAHALSEVHHELDDADRNKDLTNTIPVPMDQVVMNQKQVLTGISIVMIIAMIFGAVVGRTS